MPPKRKARVVRWLVVGVGRAPTSPPIWLDRPLTEHENKYATVLAYGMDDGTVRYDGGWRTNAAI